MAKRLQVELADGTETWIELSGEITRRAERRMWKESQTPMEAVNVVLGDANMELDFQSTLDDVDADDDDDEDDDA